MKTVVIFNKRDIANPTWGGGETYVHEIAKGLARKYRVVLLTIGHQGKPLVEMIDGVEVHRIGTNVTLGRFLLPLYFRRHFAKADLVIDSVTVIPWFTPLFANHRSLLIFHQLVGDIFFQELPLIVSHLAFFVEPFLYRPYKNLPAVTPSPSSRDALARLGVDSGHVRIVLPGVFSSFLEQGRLASSKREPVMVCLSRIVAYKGIQYVIAALPRILRKVPQARLIIVGKGPHLPQLIRLARNLAVTDHVTFTGYLSEEEKMNVLGKARVLVFPSRREGWGNNILEANALRTPAVGWNSPGIKDAIVDGQTGFLVPPEDTDLLAEKVVTLLTDDVCWKEMSERAFAWAKEHPWENTEARILEVVQDLIGS
jgi:glycosyltransferase involved in cell wall biosynthesis